MSTGDDQSRIDTQRPSGKGVSRRGVLTGAGIAVAGGVVATVDTSASAASAAKSDPTRLGVGRQGSTTAEFRGRIEQTGSAGETFTAYGYMIALAGATDSDLFSSASKNDATALLTVFATGSLVNRVLDTAVHSLDIVGSLDVYQRSASGASFADPNTFKVGTRVASFALTLQDVLAVFAPAQGIPTLTGDMRQSFAGALSGSLSGRKFGSSGMNLRMFATGLGTLVDPVTLNARLEIAGNWVAE